MTEATKVRRPRARKSYEARTGMNSRANIITVAAMAEKPKFHEDDDGNIIREWKAEEMQRYSNEMIAAALRNTLAVTEEEMLGTVPPTAIKYCVTKGWLVANASKTLFTITLKGAIDLNLPLHYRGKFNGRKIPFVGTAK